MSAPDAPNDFDELVGLLVRNATRPGDFAGWLSAALILAAELVGDGDQDLGAAYMISGRPGCWEAEHVYRLAGGR